ncbi:uncharacterized protein LOC101741099 [Bombyx mori]|uniref:Uncharacterized protein n=1 Tax=Bombyx mori TaxID=7091 RepID=A0A8R2ANP3_BOMMO|nr:uncharacterized protein LOC101741099 [Bombyx mori]
MVKLNISNLLLVIFALNNISVYGQINNVRLVDHADYMITVIQKTVEEFENREWCNFKLPDVVQEINEVIFGQETKGTVKYANGFLVSVQHLDIMQSTVQQFWNRTHPGLVEVRGRLRMHDVTVGFDVLANLDGEHRYSGTYRHPMVNFDFTVQKDLNIDELSVNVIGSVPNSNNLVRFLPEDRITDILNTVYNRASSTPGIVDWAFEIIQPIADEIVQNEVQFPIICYNCPVR